VSENLQWAIYGGLENMVHLTLGQPVQVRVRGHWYNGKVAHLTTYAAVIWYTPKGGRWGGAEIGTVIPFEDVPKRVLDRDDDNAC
jgi:hypothetical protein